MPITTFTKLTCFIALINSKFTKALNNSATRSEFVLIGQNSRSWGHRLLCLVFNKRCPRCLETFRGSIVTRFAETSFSIHLGRMTVGHGSIICIRSFLELIAHLNWNINANLMHICLCIIQKASFQFKNIDWITCRRLNVACCLWHNAKHELLVNNYHHWLIK